MRLTSIFAPAALLVAFVCVASCARSASPSSPDAREDDASTDPSDATSANDATPDAVIAPWSRSFTDGLDLIGLDMAVSRRGQVAVVGAFRQTVDFGIGPITTVHPYEHELFVAVFDPNGR